MKYYTNFEQKWPGYRMVIQEKCSLQPHPQSATAFHPIFFWKPRIVIMCRHMVALHMTTWDVTCDHKTDIMPTRFQCVCM